MLHGLYQRKPLRCSSAISFNRASVGAADIVKRREDCISKALERDKWYRRSGFRMEARKSSLPSRAKGETLAVRNADAIGSRELALLCAPDSFRLLFLRCGRFALKSRCNHRLQDGIMARSLGPSCSMGFCCSRWRVARKLGQPFSFSAIQAFAKLPLRISARILAHLFACLFRDDARRQNNRLLGCIADGVAHVAKASTVNQVNDELEFVEAFEISDFGLVACFRERLEARFDQFTLRRRKVRPARQEIGLCFFRKSGL